MVKIFDIGADEQYTDAITNPTDMKRRERRIARGILQDQCARAARLSGGSGRQDQPCVREIRTARGRPKMSQPTTFKTLNKLGVSCDHARSPLRLHLAHDRARYRHRHGRSQSHSRLGECPDQGAIGHCEPLYLDWRDVDLSWGALDGSRPRECAQMGGLRFLSSERETHTPMKAAQLINLNENST